MMSRNDEPIEMRRAFMTTATKGLTLLLLALSACSVAACSDNKKEPVVEEEEPPPPPPEVAEVTATVKYEDDALLTFVSSLHMWIVEPRTEGDAGVLPNYSTEKDPPSLTCQNLISGRIDPYDLSFHLLGEAVSGDIEGDITAPEVLLGEGLVYVEAINFEGEAELAGCEDITVEQPSTEVTITFGKAGVADCSDPEAEDGAPCDDGMNCTSGETCKKGKCQGGEKRDCTQLADDCNAASCDEELGCVAEPLSDDTPCDDGMYCTTGDSCLDGVCVGSARDCSAQAGPCQTNAVCNELTQSCEFQDALTGTPCEDGLFCTVNDQCTFGGICSPGTTRDCSDRDGECFVGQCDDDADACVAVADQGATCDDGNDCTGTVLVPDSCDAAGVCQPGADATITSSCEDGDPCTGTVGVPDACDGSGTCVAGDAVADNVACDDGDPCTSSTTCQTGVCTGGSYNSTTYCSTDPCTTYSQCNYITGECDPLTTQLEGSVCSDGDETTGDDMCNDSGVCVGIPD